MTANLIVGVDTTKAKTDLQSFKQWVKVNVDTAALKVVIDPSSIEQSVSAYLKQRSFNVNTKDLSNQIQNDVDAALQRAFNKQRNLNWDQANLASGLNATIRGAFDGLHKLHLDTTSIATQVREAVAAGLAGANLRLGITGSAAAPQAAQSLASSGLITDMKAVMAQALAPAVDELAKAASLIAGTVRKANLDRGEAALTRSSASKSQSRSDPLTGERFTVRTPIEAGPTLADIQAARAAQFGPDRIVKDAADASRRRAQETADEVNAVGERAAILKRLRAQARGEELNEAGQRVAQLRQIRAQSRGDELNDVGQRAEQLRQRRAQTRGDEINEVGQRASQLRQLRAQTRGEELNETGQRMAQLRQLRAQARSEELNDVGQRASQLRQLRVQARSDDLNAAGERATQLAARRAQRKQETDEIRAFNAEAKFLASKTYTGKGADIAAAQATATKYGAAPTRQVLGPTQGFLLGQTSELESYRKKLGEIHKPVNDVKAAHDALNGVMREMQSGARGLAGSLGALWTTYGSVVPLVAAAAIGASLRSVFKTGKDVEYQLAFVSALSDGAVVSMDKFNQAIKGSQVGPIEAAQAMRGLAQNGLSVAESLRVLPDILSLATAGEMSLSEAALGATGVMVAFGLTVNDLGRVGDVFAKAAAISNTSVTGMVEAMKQASVVGDQFHVSLEQTAATLAVLAQRNITNTAAGTAFRNMMTELATPSVKARAALKSMHLELYDGSNQLLGYETVMKRLHDTVITLNERSKLNFLKDVFNERGDKAANAMIADFDSFGEKLDEIKNKSKDFTQSVVDTLGDTTQGKIKKLFSEFEVSATSAFNGASESVGGLVNSLRLLVASDSFTGTLTGLVNGVVSLSKFLQENAAAVGTTIAVWAGFKVVDAVVSSFIAMKAALKGAEIGVAALGITARTALGFLTGGLSIVTALAAEYFLLRKNTDDATSALSAHTDALKLANDESTSHIKRMMGENDVLIRQNELMWQGVDASKARKQAEGEVQTRATEDLGKTLKDNQLKIALKEAQLRASEGADRNATPTFGEVSLPQRSSETPQLRAELAALKKDTEQVQRAFDNASTLKRESDLRLKVSQSQSLVGDVNQFNKTLTERKKLKASITVEAIDIDWAKSHPEDEVRAELKRRTAVLEKGQLNTYNKEDPQARSNELSKSRSLLSRLKDEEDATKQAIKFRKELDDAKYNPALFGTFVSASLAEQREIEGTTTLIQLQKKQVEELKVMKASGQFKENDRRDIQTKIDHLEEEYKANERNLGQQKELAAIKSSNERRKDDRDFNKSLLELKGQDVFDLKKQRDAVSNKVIDKGDAAAVNAERAVEEEYRKRSVSYQERLVVLQESEKSLLNERAALLSGSTEVDLSQLTVKDRTIAAVREEIALETARLAIMNAQSSAAARTSGQVAKNLYAQSQTAQFGWDHFWKDYTENAESAAKQVETILKSATDNMSNSLANFVRTGKLSFGDLVRSILADVTKAWSSRQMKALFEGAGDSGGIIAGLGKLLGFGGSSGASSGLQSYSSSDVELLMASGFASGGVMTSAGPARLRKYARGGVSHGPEVSIHGEGARPEAYVPLQDGRSIPVTVDSKQNAPAPISINYAPVIHIDSRSDQAQIAKMVSATVAQGQKDLVQHLRDVGAIT